MIIFFFNAYGLIILQYSSFCQNSFFSFLQNIFFSSSLDPPGTPNCIDVTRDSVTLQWEPPKRDGGSRIVAYSVERRQGRARWLRCNFIDISECQFTVTGLPAGDRFEFRVIARNAVGTVSPPSQSSGYIMTKDECGMYIQRHHSIDIVLY